MIMVYFARTKPVSSQKFVAIATLRGNWLAEKGVAEKANWVREHFLTGSTIATTVILLILLVSPRNGSSKVFGFVRRCPVCDHRLIGRANYCGDCGSKVA